MVLWTEKFTEIVALYADVMTGFWCSHNSFLSYGTNQKASFLKSALLQRFYVFRLEAGHTGLNFFEIFTD